jgi:DNA-binding GntR family transcriptional regulator
MPKKYGVKEKDLVVAHIVSQVLTGRLRSGDRLDRNEIANELGLSRVPVQEAIVQLEHDGVLSTRYHRGAYVEAFDEHVLLENFELHGVLTGIASARAATHPSAKLVHQLEKRMEKVRASVETRHFHENTWRFRKVINDSHTGPRLAAAIRAAQIFMPADFWTAYMGNHDEILPFYEAEYTAIIGRQPDAARAACAARAEVVGRIMLTELVRRRVLGQDDALASF